MKTKPTCKSAFLSLGILIVLVCAGLVYLMVAGTLPAFLRPAAPATAPYRTLSFVERVGYQQAIEEVYWRNRIWPTERPDPKPPLDEVMSQAQLETKVEDYLRNSQALEDHWQRPITAEQLQAEMDRIAQHTRQPEVLRELFAALGNDPLVIAECLARPVLTQRLSADLSAQEKTGRLDALRTAETQMPKKVAAIDSIAKAIQVSRPYQLPTISDAPNGCTGDTWTATSTVNVPTARSDHTAVWTGTEMIVWGGGHLVGNNFVLLNTGGRYNPSTDSWTATSTINAPTARSGHTAVWTGSEMIVWGGIFVNTGGRYNPSTDSWTATSTTNAPSTRSGHVAVWIGGRMIVWGGGDQGGSLNTGGRYNPSTDSWTATSTTNAPAGRVGYTAVSTNSEMIVWGGLLSSSGARYNPTTDTWTPTSITNAPIAGLRHAVVWSGSEMIVWGGARLHGEQVIYLNTGGRYNPSTDTWTATSTTNAPVGRWNHTAIWTGSEMIVWGGSGRGDSNTGGRYDPGTDGWTATTTINAPSGRVGHTAVSTGSEMIVWGGDDGTNVLNTGGRYCAEEAPARLGNISTRAFVQTGNNVMIGGFIVQGTGTKRVIIRIIAPELTQFGLSGAMTDPTLELHDGTGALIARNDNWQTSIIGGIITGDQTSDIQSSGFAPGDARECAIIADLPAGNYTAIVRGVNNTTGVALVEVYDLSPETNSILGNISTRSFVQTGDNVMIGGVIVQGTQPKHVIIRTIGPELTQFGVPDVLANPTFELHDSSGALIASNNNWHSTIIGGIITGDQVSDIQNSGYAPTAASESAIIANLPPGNYTAIVRGVNDTTGVALVEVYDLP